jgi:DNA-binding winged helix-turn-helix (wHTH) protein
MRLVFAEYVLDLGAHQLLCRGQAVPLSPKALRLLQLLLEARPHALSKDELRRGLWPETAVADANLSNLVGEVRSALQDDARRPRFVRTVHRHGYAFCGEAAALRSAVQPGAEPRLRLRWPGGSAELGPGEHVVGRDAGAAVCVVSPSVSRRHALLRVAAGGASVEDLGSKNGTFVNEVPVDGPRPLADGDEVRAGSVPVTVRLWQPVASTETGIEDGED